MNLRALAEQRPELGPVPSYSTIRRFFKAQGLHQAPALELAAHGGRRARGGALGGSGRCVVMRPTT